MRLIVATRIWTERLVLATGCGISFTHFAFAGGAMCAYDGYAVGLQRRGGWLRYLLLCSAADGWSVVLQELAVHWAEVPLLAGSVDRLRHRFPPRPRFTVTPWEVMAIDQRRGAAWLEACDAAAIEVF